MHYHNVGYGTHLQLEAAQAALKLCNYVDDTDSDDYEIVIMINDNDDNDDFESDNVIDDYNLNNNEA